MEVVYVCLDNWAWGEDYPALEKYEKLVDIYHGGSPLCDGEWLKANGICCRMFPFDMSVAWLLTVPRAWAEENWPELFGEWRKFLAEPDDGGCPPVSRFGVPFREWSEDSLGLERVDDPYYADEEIDEETDEAAEDDRVCE